MKKVATGAILCVVFVIIYFLQLNFFNWFTIAGVKPNLFVILALFTGLYTGRKIGRNNGNCIWTFNRYIRE